MKSTTKLSIGIVGILVLSLITIQATSSPNQPDERPVGYEYLDNESVLHLKTLIIPTSI